MKKIIGGERSEPHTSELAGGFSILWYVHDSIYLYDLFKRRPAPGLGMRSRLPPQFTAFPLVNEKFKKKKPVAVGN